VYAVAKALHKAGYGEDVVEMREAAQAALDAAHDLARATAPYRTVDRRHRAEGIVRLRRLAEEWAMPHNTVQ
jgi:ABC-type branched-subunit amino acid transport system substrate-binding protein